MKEESKKYCSNYPNNYPKNYTNNCPNNYTNSNKLNKTQLEIIDIIRNNPIISVRELTEIIENITLSGVKWNLKWMKDKGLIERVGTTRKGQWIIKDENIEMK